MSDAATSFSRVHFLLVQVRAYAVEIKREKITQIKLDKLDPIMSVKTVSN